MKPGDIVIYRRSTCRVVDVVDAPTPGGGTVTAILIERPRAGQKWVSLAEIERHAVPQASQATEEPFGHFGPDATG